ncbi:hypothetical protein ACTOB_003521 [Actinoplanes oblitus]|uniref:Uncharacterized protein n=1 Tax=Actinoplanes oblitus TaxID=3040509 RepID=A0ABY8WV53_9ACTN|nr:hypothetical protein [Actinoplanes oblitus]WIM99855.1 hypothetical protein ACTOB_003521 [Actinoplanes oblitus]
MRALLAAAGLAVICVAAGCGSAGTPPGPAPSAQLTIGFGGYGPLRAGMTRAELLAATPVPLEQYGDAPGCAFLADARAAGRNPYGELQVTLDDRGRVLGIDPPSAARTDRGVAVGSSDEQLRDAYADPAEQGTNESGRYLVYGSAAQGWLGFGLDEAGNVVEIRTGTKDFASGFEVCSGE